MAKNPSDAAEVAVSLFDDVKDPLTVLQLHLFEGIQDENLLFRAGLVMSRSNYENVVTERSIDNRCGYPLCSNTLPLEQPRKGHYRISLKQHTVYDQHETDMYCSADCVKTSRAFALSLPEERSLALNAEIDKINRLFEGMKLDFEDGFGKNGGSGSSELKIQENTETKVGCIEELSGPSNAIEGYVPKSNRTFTSSVSKNKREGSTRKIRKGIDLTTNGTDFASTIITVDEPGTSEVGKTVPCTAPRGSKGKVGHKDTANKFSLVEAASSTSPNNMGGKLRKSKGEKNITALEDMFSALEVSSTVSVGASGENDVKESKELNAEETVQASETKLRSSLKSSGVKKISRSVTWADKNDTVGHKKLCEIRELEDTKEGTYGSHSDDVEDEDSVIRFNSAEACAAALSQAAEAVASGQADVIDAVSKAGISLLARPPDADIGDAEVNVDMFEHETEPAPLKWPRKPGLTNLDVFDAENSWFDSPPEGFSLDLSPFATMWMALFAWITSSSLAYIYGQDESFHEDYLAVNGREYPCKISLSDGRSSEIKQTIAACLAQALPEVIAELRLPMPISTLEKGMGCFLDTMSFVDPLPPFRFKQWQVIVLLFIDGLSVCRIPSLIPHMTSCRMLFDKVLDGAKVTVEEYEVMKDLIIPLGRVPRFSPQCGA
ncbi:Rtr1/RPAP2 domain [Dillenia turbinata]|uniref:RNA polymerase II subunit B1 CTD phosphatase RPAP2 homolog n=1 Tax=Dillenia turbinata TaxID=194707 RepID=A0AAN8UD03_9MAGN